MYYFSKIHVFLVRIPYDWYVSHIKNDHIIRATGRRCCVAGFARCFLPTEPPSPAAATTSAGKCEGIGFHLSPSEISADLFTLHLIIYIYLCTLFYDMF